MNVKQLIDALSAFDPESDVFCVFDNELTHPPESVVGYGDITNVSDDCGIVSIAFDFEQAL